MEDEYGDDLFIYTWLNFCGIIVNLGNYISKCISTLEIVWSNTGWSDKIIEKYHLTDEQLISIARFEPFGPSFVKSHMTPDHPYYDLVTNYIKSS